MLQVMAQKASLYPSEGWREDLRSPLSDPRIGVLAVAALMQPVQSNITWLLVGWFNRSVRLINQLGQSLFYSLSFHLVSIVLILSGHFGVVGGTFLYLGVLLSTWKYLRVVKNQWVGGGMFWYFGVLFYTLCVFGCTFGNTGQGAMMQGSVFPIFTGTTLFPPRYQQKQPSIFEKS